MVEVKAALVVAVLRQPAERQPLLYVRSGGANSSSVDVKQPARTIGEDVTELTGNLHIVSPATADGDAQCTRGCVQAVRSGSRFSTLPIIDTCPIRRRIGGFWSRGSWMACNRAEMAEDLSTLSPLSATALPPTAAQRARQGLSRRRTR